MYLKPTQPCQVHQDDTEEVKSHIKGLFTIQKHIAHLSKMETVASTQTLKQMDRSLRRSQASSTRAQL